MDRKCLQTRFAENVLEGANTIQKNSVAREVLSNFSSFRHERKASTGVGIPVRQLGRGTADTIYRILVTKKR